MTGRQKARIRALFERCSGLVFDVDGTLIDTRSAHLRAWEKTIAAFGIAASRKALESYFGKRSDYWAAVLLPDASEKERRRLVKAKEAAFMSLLPSLKPFAGAVELLRFLKRRGKKIAFATGATKEELAVHMRKLRAGRIVDATVYDSEAKRGKPYPDAYHLALKRLGLKSQEAVAIGDSLYDAQAAQSAGIECLAVRTGGFSRQALLDAGATLVVRDVAKILAALQNHGEG
jgi:membrane protein